MVSPDKIRMMLRDKEELNVLLSGQEQFEDDEIAIFDGDCRDELILLYPAFTAKRDVIPDIVIAQGVVSKLMEAVGHEQVRNQMGISDNNVGQIDMSNKGDKYFGIANSYYERMKIFAQSMAASDYYNNMWGSIQSESSAYDEGTWYY